VFHICKAFIRHSLPSYISVYLCHRANLLSSSRSFDPSSCSNPVPYLKLTKHFLFSARSVCFSDPYHRAYPFKRSFKAFLLSGVLSVVSLFVCFVCLCPMIDAHRVNVVREVLKSLKLKILSNYPLVKGKCVLDLLS
jgi:hypothetical protein